MQLNPFLHYMSHFKAFLTQKSSAITPFSHSKNLKAIEIIAKNTESVQSTSKKPSIAIRKACPTPHKPYFKT